MLTPGATVILGNLQYDAQIAGLKVSLAPLPGVNRFEVTIPAGVRLDAVPGDPAELQFDGGEGVETVLTGKVASLRRGIYATEVSATDGGADLAAFRAGVTYEKQQGKDIIRALASEVSAGIGRLDLDLPLAVYVAQQGRTAAEHIAHLASLVGALVTFGGDGKLNVAAIAEEPELALLFGREILHIETTERAAPSAMVFRVGNGPAGSHSAANALRPSAKPLPEDAPKPGKTAIWQPTLALRTPGAATGASEATSKQNTRDATRLYARCFALPKLRPGNIVEIQELPNGMSKGPWLITSVTHRFAPGSGGITTFESCAASGGDFDLLGALLSLAGSLL
jgi:hypothetical protein